MISEFFRLMHRAYIYKIDTKEHAQDVIKFCGKLTFIYAFGIIFNAIEYFMDDYKKNDVFSLLFYVILSTHFTVMYILYRLRYYLVTCYGMLLAWVCMLLFAAGSLIQDFLFYDTISVFDFFITIIVFLPLCVLFTRPYNRGIYSLHKLKEVNYDNHKEGE